MTRGHRGCCFREQPTSWSGNGRSWRVYWCHRFRTHFFIFRGVLEGVGSRPSVPEDSAAEPSSGGDQYDGGTGTSTVAGSTVEVLLAVAVSFFSFSSFSHRQKMGNAASIRTSRA